MAARRFSLSRVRGSAHGSTAPNELHRRDLVPAGAALDRGVPLTELAGGLLIFQVKHTQTPRVVGIEHWAENHRDIARSNRSCQ